MALLSYDKLSMLSQVEAVRNLSILYDIYGISTARAGIYKEGRTFKAEPLT
jgi:hypothetical protein